MPVWLTWALVRRIVIVVGLILFGYYLITFVQVAIAAGHDDRRPSEAIIVLGAAQYDGRPTDVFKARLDHAYDLWINNNASLGPCDPNPPCGVIVVTGGKQPGDRFTEAQAGYQYLLAKQVPTDRILLEVNSRNSVESLQASAQVLKERGLTRVILVSDGFHSLRIRLIAEEVGLDAVTSPTRTSPITGFDVWKRYASEALRVAVGRVFGFGRAVRVGKLVPGLAILGSVGGGVIGNTAGSGPVVEGSSPSPRAPRRRRARAARRRTRPRRLEA